MFKREIFVHPRRGLGLQAFGLGGDHCEGRLFSWSLDGGALTSGVRGNPSICAPPPKNHLGKHIPMKHGEVSDDFFMWKKNGRCFLKYFLVHFYPSSLQNFHETKKSFQFSNRQGLGGIRWWWSASQRQCTWWTLCADQLHWQCLYLCPPGICGTNQVRRFADFSVGWDFWDGIQSFWGRVRWVKRGPEIRH